MISNKNGRPSPPTSVPLVGHEGAHDGCTGAKKSLEGIDLPFSAQNVENGVVEQLADSA